MSDRLAWRLSRVAAFAAAVAGVTLACRMAFAEPLPADDRPRLPCALEAPWPPYPTIGSAPIARAWVIQDEYGLGCADWPRGTPVVVVALAARVSGRDALSDIVQRFAAVS